MYLWLTLDADVRCEHPGGFVDVTASQDLVRVEGRPVVVGRDPVGRSIAGCPNLSAATKPCTKTLGMRLGPSGFVHVEGRAVVRADLVGVTDGTPQGGVAYRVTDPGQTLVGEQP